MYTYMLHTSTSTQIFYMATFIIHGNIFILVFVRLHTQIDLHIHIHIRMHIHTSLCADRLLLLLVSFGMRTSLSTAISVSCYPPSDPGRHPPGAGPDAGPRNPRDAALNSKSFLRSVEGLGSQRRLNS